MRLLEGESRKEPAMADPVTETTAPETETPPAAPAFKPITTQEDFDRALGARLHEERSKTPNYDKYKADSEELTKLKEASKSELQKSQDRATAAEAKVAQLELEKQVEGWKKSVSAATGVPVDVLHSSQ
jgi:hypothetical protein